MPNKVSIATKPLVYATFRYLSHKTWNALAEYVDNSIQSFKDHKDILGYINNGKVRVDINIDLDEDIITVEDNAFGIELRNFNRAFELANIPLDASGLNEFGMGMKVSSIWLCDWWKLETTAYGDPYKRTVVFDVMDVSQNERLSLDVKLEQCTKYAHYTKLTLTKLSNNKPSKRSIPSIKKHLASIYIQFIRDGILDLYVNGELLVPENPKILNAPYHRDPKGPSILWKHDINFEVPKYVNGKMAGYYKAKGFIGILETMSNNTDNGILLFRRGRVIGSSYDEKYRPSVLLGSVGSPRYKRIFGELELDGFNVSFNKASFVEDEDFNVFIETLKEDIASDRTLDLFGQAENYRSLDKKDKRKISSTFVDVLKGKDDVTLTGDDLNPIEPLYTPNKGQGTDNNNDSGVSHQPETGIQDKEANSAIRFDDISRKINILGKEYNLTIGCNFNRPEGIYTLTKSPTNDCSVRADINMNNPFFDVFSETFKTKDGIESVITFINAMIGAELTLWASGGDYREGASFRKAFNNVFGKI